jgi:hypothetical protein
MSERFNPLAPVSKYSRAEVEKLFGPRGDAAIAARTFRENKPLYDELRQAACDHRILGPSAIQSPAPYSKEKPQRSYSDRELFLRAKYSESELRDFFSGKGGNSSKVHAEHPEIYKEMKEGAIGYGILPPSSLPAHSDTPQPRSTEPQATGEEFVLEPRIAKEMGLPEGYKCNQLGFHRIMQTIANAAADKAATAERARLEAEAAA